MLLLVDTWSSMRLCADKCVCLQYHSHTSVEGNEGCMQGSFQCIQFEKEDLSDMTVIDAKISPFRLLSPGIE